MTIEIVKGLKFFYILLLVLYISFGVAFMNLFKVSGVSLLKGLLGCDQNFRGVIEMVSGVKPSDVSALSIEISRVIYEGDPPNGSVLMANSHI